MREEHAVRRRDEVDAQVSYESKNGLVVMLQGTTCTQLMGEKYLAGHIQNFGRGVYVGASHSFWLKR